MLPHQRAKILHKVADLIEAQLDELTQKQSRDNGKPLAEARGLVMSAAGTARYLPPPASYWKASCRRRGRRIY